MVGQRAVEFSPLDIAPGIFTGETPAGAVRRWRDGDNVRWDSMHPQKMGGYVQNPMYDPEDATLEVEYAGKARSYHEWQSLDGETWLAFGTACKLYLVNKSVLYDITPQRRQAYITDGVTTVNGSMLVTITDTDHAAQDGDHITIEGGVAVGGITLSGQYDIVQVLDLNTYTINAGVAASSGATGGGSMTLKYDISCGLESDGPLYGYGVGPYGLGTFGTARTSSDLIGKARTWSLGNWGEDLVASPSGGTLYRWRRSSGPQSRAESVPGAPENIERMIVGPDNKHIIALGTNLASTGVQDRMFLRWNVQDDINDWTLTGENDAGSKRLDVGSYLITAVKSNRQILAWSDKGLYVGSLVGGQDVYGWTFVAASPKLVSQESAIDVDGTVYAMCEDDFYIFDGTYRAMPCDLKELVFGDGEEDSNYLGINRDQMSKVTVRLRRQFSEIRWSMPEYGQTENSIDIVYNYALKCWYVSSVPRETGGDKVSSYGYAIGLHDGKMWFEESGVDADDVALPAFLESWETQLANGTLVAEVTELVPDFMRLSGTMELTLFGRNWPSELVTIGPVREISEDTKHLTPKFKKRQIGFRIESLDIGDDWRMGTWRGKYIPHGQ